MTLAWIAALIGVLLALLLWRRRLVARRRRRCRDQLARLLAELRPHLRLVEIEPARWRLERQGRELAGVNVAALTRAAQGDEAHRRRLFLALADAAESGPRPLAGEFDLKRHGARTLPRLADEGLALLELEPPPARFVAIEAAELPWVYLVDGEPRPSYVTEEQLAGAGIDARDLHGVALAVLRQRFDEAAVRAALDGADAVEIAPADGCGGSRLLLLPEALGGDETLFAAAPSPELLLVGAGRAALAGALAGLREPPGPLPPAVFRVTASGLSKES